MMVSNQSTLSRHLHREIVDKKKAKRGTLKGRPAQKQKSTTNKYMQK